MMKNKITKIILNGVVLAAMAALGITVYQIGTSPVKDSEEELLFEEEQESTAEDDSYVAEEPMVDADTDNVEASLDEENREEETTDVNGGVMADSEVSEDVLSGEESAKVNAEIDAQEDVLVTETAALPNLPEVNFSRKL